MEWNRSDGLTWKFCRVEIPFDNKFRGELKTTTYFVLEFTNKYNYIEDDEKSTNNSNWSMGGEGRLKGVVSNAKLISIVLQIDGSFFLKFNCTDFRLFVLFWVSRSWLNSFFFFCTVTYKDTFIRKQIFKRLYIKLLQNSITWSAFNFHNFGVNN